MLKSWMRSRFLVSVLMVATCINGFMLWWQTLASAAVHDGRSVHERVTAWSPSADETRFMQIPWRHDLDTALAEAKSRHRLVLAVVSNGDLCSGRL